MDNNQLEKYPSFSLIWGTFWSENRVTFARKQGNLGKGVKFNFSVAALISSELRVYKSQVYKIKRRILFCIY